MDPLGAKQAIIRAFEEAGGNLVVLSIGSVDSNRHRTRLQLRDELQQATFAEALALVLIFLEQALAAVPEMTRELLRSLIDRFLRDLPPIYGARWLLAWQNNTAYC